MRRVEKIGRILIPITAKRLIQRSHAVLIQRKILANKKWVHEEKLNTQYKKFKPKYVK
jgi:hypothetical protein